jgi:hypothetical protein
MALTTLSFKYSWILILDADERLPSSLESKLKSRIIDSPESICGFRLRRRDFLGKTWLKHSQISPFYVRLVRVGKAAYHREINEVLLVDGEVENLNECFDHFPFSKGLNHWITKHNQYSTMEAMQWVKENSGNHTFSFKKALFSKDFSEKRYHQKGLFYKLPGRPMLKWCYMVIWRMGFLDGRAGITYATLQAIYEYFIVLKTKKPFHKEVVSVK